MGPRSQPCSQNQNVYQLLHLVSFACLNLPLGVGWYFGNLVVYLNSYWYSELNDEQFLSSWVISVFSASWCVGETVGGLIIKKTDRTITILFIGLLCFDMSYCLSYLAVQYSQALFIAVFGALLGLGAGFIQAENLTRIPTLLTKRPEIPIIVMFNSFNLGGVAFDWIMTWYANPDNAVADQPALSGQISVFTQKSVIDRVPYIFIVLGILTTICQIIGFAITVILGDKGTSRDNQISSSCIDKKIAVTDYNSSEFVSMIDGNNEDNTNPYVNDTAAGKSERAIVCNEKMPCETTTLCSSFHEDISKCVRGQTKQKKVDLTNTDEKAFAIGDLSPIQMLKTFTYYVVALNLMINDASYLVLLNFYKIFGQLWIHDDHFMTQLGMFSIAVAIVFRSMLAVIINKHGVRNTQVCMNASMSLTFLLYYFTPQISRWIFAALTCFMAGLCSSVYALCPVTTLKLFGDSHLAANSGILLSSIILVNLVAPQCMQFVIETWGWCALFQITGGLNAIALVTSIIALPNSV